MGELVFWVGTSLQEGSLYCNLKAVDGGIKVFDPFNVYKTMRANEREITKNRYKKGGIGSLSSQLAQDIFFAD